MKLTQIEHSCLLNLVLCIQSAPNKADRLFEMALERSKDLSEDYKNELNKFKNAPDLLEHAKELRRKLSL